MPHVRSAFLALIPMLLFSGFPEFALGAGPSFAITKTHIGNFAQGQVGATYTITVNNTGTASATGTTTVVDTLPGGLTATAIAGSGWACDLGTLTCMRSDPLAAGSPFPAITLTVNVSCTAPGVVTNTVRVTNPGVTVNANDTAMNPATVTATLGCGAPPDLIVTKTHGGGPMFPTYTIAVTNIGGSPSAGTVTVTDTLPAGLTATSIAGTGWACDLPALTCTRADPLPIGGSYPPITLTVNVTVGAPGVVTNSATVSGGGEINLANDRTTDPTTLDAFQVRYASNLNIGDSVVNVTNNGANATATNGGFAGGSLCINAYVFDQSEEMLACCSCFVTPNGLASFSVKSQLISNSLTPEIPNSVVIKLLATGSTGGCDPTGVTFATLAPGMRAFGTTLHAVPSAPVTYGVTETPFSVSSLSQAELNHLTSFCAFIESNASGFGICQGCSVGGLGSTTHP